MQTFHRDMDDPELVMPDKGVCQSDRCQTVYVLTLEEMRALYEAGVDSEVHAARGLLTEERPPYFEEYLEEMRK